MLNYISRFYSNQEKLRGVTSVAQVEYLENAQSTLYDQIIYKYLYNYANGKIVELASGPGIFLRYLKNKGFENYIGIEMADASVKLCLEQKLNVIKEDALEWLKSQSDSSIDVIIAIDFIEHLNKENFVELLDLVKCKLSPSGLFIARGPCGDSPLFGLNYFNDITHETVFTSVAIGALFSMCNLELLESFDEYPVIVKKQKIYKFLLVKFSRLIVRKIIFWSTGHNIYNLSPNFWIIGKPKY